MMGNKTFYGVGLGQREKRNWNPFKGTMYKCNVKLYLSMLSLHFTVLFQGAVPIILLKLFNIINKSSEKMHIHIV